MGRSARSQGGLENGQEDHHPRVRRASQTPSTHAEYPTWSPDPQGWENTFREPEVHFALLLNSVKIVFQLVSMYFKPQ